jgi:hypothetical protein
VELFSSESLDITEVEGLDSSLRQKTLGNQFAQAAHCRELCDPVVRFWLTLDQICVKFCRLDAVFCHSSCRRGEVSTSCWTD